MHQHPRPAPRSAASASNAATNPERTNNQRDTLPPQRTRSSVDLASYTDRGESSSSAVQDREQAKLNQIIQNFHTKAALVVCSSRASLPQVLNNNGDLKQNRWFNLILDETDILLDDLEDWRRQNLSSDPPPPLEIEVYLDTSHLTQNQALVVADEAGKQWEVADSAASSADSSPRPKKPGKQQREVVLERWTIELGDTGRYKAAQLHDPLPNVYKKGVVLFRSLHTFSRLLPAWKLHKRLVRQPGNSQALRLRFRIRQGRSSSAARLAKDALQTPLCPTDLDNNNIAEHHDFPPLLCAAGPLSISVDYRTNCDLYVADAEALLSSRFAGLDAGANPRGDHRRAGGYSLPGSSHHSAAAGGTGGGSNLGGTSATARARVAGGGAYGSLGTFHTTNKRESPISALRSRTLTNEYDDMSQPPSRGTPQSIPYSGARDYLKNPPFKAGSVATSPRNTATPSPSSSAPRPSALTGTSTQSKRLSLNTLPQQALRNPGGAIDTAIASSGSASPKPAPARYSSSFAGRTKFTSTSKPSGAGSNTSSGRGSTSSKEKSGQLNDGTPGGSSGSARTDEDDIAAFISTVERAKDLKAFTARKPPASINLNKFKGMTAQSSELADEMSSSSLIQTSLTPPSRRLSNVPGLSTSSSPSRVMAGHVPHVRSRLSTHSIAEEKEDNRSAELEGPVDEVSDEDEPFIFQQDNLED